MTKAYFETLAVFAGMILAIATVFFVGVSAVFIVYAWSDIWN